MTLLQRQISARDDRGVDYFDPTGTDYAIRYGVTIGVVVVLLLALIGAYYHARFRLQEGKPLLAYHRWMMRNPSGSSWAHNNPQGRLFYAGYGVTPQNQHRPTGNRGPQHEMGTWRPAPSGQGGDWVPPPAYNSDIPPAYAPPPGATKVAPQQEVQEVRANGEGSSSMEGLQRPEATYPGGVVR